MPGTYSITASVKGFRDVQVLVRVLVGNTTSQDIKLQVGSSQDTIKVIGCPYRKLDLSKKQRANLSVFRSVMAWPAAKTDNMSASWAWRIARRQHLY